MRGIVVEVKKQKAIILTDKGSFVSVSNCGYTVGETVDMKPKPYRKMMAVAAGFLLVLFLGGGYGVYMTPRAYVDMDINPSIRLTVNCFERVIDIQPLNQDAEVLLESKIRKNRLGECMQEIVTLSEKRGFLNEENRTVEVHVQTDYAPVKETVAKNCDTLNLNNKREVIWEETDRPSYEKAREKGISMGKYKKAQKQAEPKKAEKVQSPVEVHQKAEPMASSATEGKTEKPSERESEPTQLPERKSEPTKKVQNVSAEKKALSPKKSVEPAAEPIDSSGEKPEKIEKTEKNHMADKKEKKKPAKSSEKPKKEKGNQDKEKNQ